jgi:YD repeat-containing protein
MKVTKFLLLLLLFSILKSQAQIEIPKLIPPSPESSALFRFLDYPVNSATGIPEISIPLYEINSGSLKVPISISYHAGGRMVFDQTGPVGLGWSLIAGGRISRTIHGKPDDQASVSAYLKSASIVDQRNEPDFNYLYNLHDPSGNEDSEYDIFSYTCGSNDGKFILNPKTGAPLLLPLKPLKIVAESGTGFPDKILDDKGIEYKFAQNEIYSNLNIPSIRPISSKLLTTITSADKKDIIEFKYKAFTLSDAHTTGELTIKDNDTRNTTDTPPTTSYQQLNNASQYVVQRLVEIIFKEGRVTFTLRDGTDQIQSIEIYNNKSELIRSITLNMSVLDSPSNTGSNQTYKLDNIAFNNNDGSLNSKYGFDYYPSQDFSAQNRDYWGYLNSLSNNNIRTVPTYDNIELRLSNGSYSTFNLQGGNRSANTPVSGVIRKIYYPTGGSTEFFFGQNRARNINGEISSAPGLRVELIRSSDNNGKITTKTFKYGQDEQGFGTLYSYFLPQFPNNMQRMSSEKRFVNINRFTGGIPNGYRVRTYSSELLPEIAELYSKPIFYSTVVIYEGDAKINIGKTVYSYNPGIQDAESTFPSATLNGITDLYIRKPYIRELNSWSSSHLSNTSIYKNIDGKFELAKVISNDFVDIPTDTVRGLIINKYIDCGSATDDKIAAAAPNYYMVFQAVDYNVITGRSELRTTSETMFTDNQTFGTKTTYNYNSHNLLSNSVTTRSDGKQITNTYKYPFDISSDVNSQMVANNMLNYGVEHEVSVDGKFINGIRTTYKNWGNSVIAPELVSTNVGSEGYQKRLNYKYYDASGHLSSTSKIAGPITSYLYGYGGRFMIAQANNANYNQIAYGDFESDDLGNWSYLTNGIIDSDSKSGNRSFIGSMSCVLYLQGASYTVSLWAKGSGNVSVNNISQRIDGAWKLYSWTVNSPQGVTVNSQGNKIDDVCLYPVDSQMQTFTYKPLVGLTSSTDESGRTTFYKYDGYQRLKETSDQDKNIISNVQYNTVNFNYYSKALSIIKQKNDCASDSHGSDVEYALSEGAYTSNISQDDADHKAQNDLNSNAQSYANTHGTCFQYYNRRVSRFIAKNDCSNGVGTQVEYIVPENKYTSGISTEDANQKAVAEIDQYGQAYANTQGICISTSYSSAAQGAYFSKFCGFGYIASPDKVSYSVPAGKYTSLISQADADSKAFEDLQNNGRTYADQHSSCQVVPNTEYRIYNLTSFSFTISFSNGSGGVTKTVPSGTTNITVPDYLYNSISISASSCNTCNFTFTYGSQVVKGGYVTFPGGTSRTINIGN